MAVPFNLDDEEIEAQIIRMLKIERLIKELLSVLRWTPWASVTCELIFFSIFQVHPITRELTRLFSQVNFLKYKKKF